MQNYYSQSAFDGRVKIKVRPYSIKELASIYEIGEKTLRKWLIPFHPELGEKRGRCYTVLQVEKIFFKLGIPYLLEQR